MKISEKLGLGTVQFGLPYGISNNAGQTASNEVGKILETAKAYKVEVLDSASAYGNSENVLGQNDLSSFKMISKFMPPHNESISIQLDNSLKILGLNSLYGYLAHRPGEILKDLGQWEELQKFKEKGKVQKIGFSLNQPEELAQLLDKKFFPDLVQVPFNYFDRRFETAVKELKNKGCEIHTRSAFLQGLFFMDPQQLDDFFNEVKPIITNLQDEKPLNGALLKFVLEKSYIDKVIIGVENESQLVQNIESLEIASSLPELKNKISENLLIPSLWPKN
ncbi:Predicted oxidoreductase [Salegentibacter salegens]|uniref:Predicted oxidoreductase n=2 Tax=Salegentibacter salegens TaxID=143223 RepID=A0A1M7HCJ9_9FLAO|nr:aryl-alcohol dehydrogenase-like predicted oxidoreductase [Salegentibacter salegens]SHM26170.1 Predicted oxidoreductase [Salegentibacter salegens]